jgi:flagellar capping protein FliD
MDWLAISAVAAVLGVIVMISGWVLNRLRKADDASHSSFSRQLDDLTQRIHGKVDKDEFDKEVGRVDRDIRDLKDDHENRFDKLEDKLDKIYDMVVKLSQSVAALIAKQP